MSEQRRLRGVWPDETAQSLARSRTMAEGFREAALQLQQVLNQLRVLADDPEADEAIRKLLAEAPVNPVDALNRLYFEWGERWHLPELLDLEFDDDDYVPTWIGSHIARLEKNTLTRNRGDGLIPAIHAGKERGFMFRVGDLRQYRRQGGARPKSGRGSAGGKVKPESDYRYS